MSDFILQFINVAMLVWKFENIPQTVIHTVWGIEIWGIPNRTDILSHHCNKCK